MTLPDIDTMSSYGGPLNNYAPVEDPTVDEDANNINKVKCNVAMATHTNLRAFAAFVTAGTGTPTDPASYVHDALWGSAIAVKPAVSRTGVGTLKVTWPQTVSDEGTVLGQTPSTHTVTLRHAKGHAEGNSFCHVQCSVTQPYEVTVYTFNSSGSLADTTGIPICVYAV